MTCSTVLADYSMPQVSWEARGREPSDFNRPRKRTPQKCIVWHVWSLQRKIFQLHSCWHDIIGM